MSENIEDFKIRLRLYEQNGPAKLYYSLNRKANEMADILNNTSLRSLDLSDAKDKTFERMKIIWNDATSITTAITGLAMAIGITGDEEKDVKKRQLITTPESIANQLGDNKSQDV
jgi:hypothetical protein